MTKKQDFKNNKLGFYQDAEGAIKMIADLIKGAEQMEGVVNKERCAEVEAAYSMLTDYFARDENVEVSCCFSETLKNMAAISIEGPILAFKDTNVLFNAAKLANNVDICGKTNGCVSFELTFYGLAKATV